MNKQERRKLNLKLLIAIKADGNITRFADISGKSQSQLSDMLRGAKSFGEKVAESIEKKVGVEKGWLDQIQGEKEDVAQLVPKELVEVLAKLDGQKVLKIMAYALEVAGESPAKAGEERRSGTAERRGGMVERRHSGIMGRRDKEDGDIWMVQGSGQPLSVSEDRPSSNHDGIKKKGRA